MRNKLFIIFLIFITVAGFVVTARNSVSRMRLKATIARIEQKIANEQLIGDEPSQVVDFLKKERIPHGEYKRKVQYYFPIQDRMITAVIPDVANTFSLIEGPFVWDIFITFKFDEDDNLIKYSVYEHPTGF